MTEISYDNYSPLLNDEYPLIIPKTLSVMIGLNEAIVLQQIQYWLKKSKGDANKFIDGRYWTYNTYGEWKENFPFWSVSTIRRTIHVLESRGFIVSRQMRLNKWDATKWYSIDYAKVNDLLKLNISSSSERAVELSQEEQLLIPKTSSETSTNILSKEMQESSRISLETVGIDLADEKKDETIVEVVEVINDSPIISTDEAIKAIQEVAIKYPGNRIIGARRPADQVMAEGAALDYSIKSEYEQTFHVFVKWEGKDGRSFLRWLKERPPDQTVGLFASWWKTQDWRGKQGQPPSINQVLELWPQAFLGGRNTQSRAAEVF